VVIKLGLGTIDFVLSELVHVMGDHGVFYWLLKGTIQPIYSTMSSS
jgi:hypothetical protein